MPKGGADGAFAFYVLNDKLTYSYNYVLEEYQASFTFTGTVNKPLVDISGEQIEDIKVKITMYLARQ